MSDEQNQAKYIVHHAENSSIGDWASTLNLKFPQQQAAADPAIAELRSLFEKVYERLDALEKADRDIVAPVVEQTAEAAAEIQQGDKSSEKQAFLAQRLKTLYAMRKDIGEVIVTTLAAPRAGIALTLQKIAQKAQAELEGGSQAETS